MIVTRKSLALTAVGIAALAALVGVLQRAGHIGPSFDALADANRLWLGAAALAFVAAFVSTAGAWRCAFRSAGAQLGARDAGARLAVGALVNAVAPAKLGDAVKVTLFSRALGAEGRMRTAGGAYAALAATRGLALALLVVVGSLVGAMPMWPAFALVACAVLPLAVSSRLRAHPRIAPFVAGFLALVRSPRALGRVAAWTVGMQVARGAATIATAAALGVPHPFLAALVILPALDVAGALPLTPGSIGVGSGAVAVALASRGIGMTQAFAVGLGIQAVETLVSVVCGGAGLAYLAWPRPRVRAVARRVALVGTAASLAAVVGATVLDLL